jgi:hypothetical protein
MDYGSYLLVNRRDTANLSEGTADDGCNRKSRRYDLSNSPELERVRKFVGEFWSTSRPKFEQVAKTAQGHNSPFWQSTVRVGCQRWSRRYRWESGPLIGGGRPPVHGQSTFILDFRLHGVYVLVMFYFGAAGEVRVSDDR